MRLHVIRCKLERDWKRLLNLERGERTGEWEQTVLLLPFSQLFLRCGGEVIGP